MSTRATFDGLTLRDADQIADLERLDKWIEADDAHRGIFAPGFFMSGELSEDPRAQCYALEDDQGVVFYIRLSRVSRVRIQFAPDTQKVRILRGLFKGMAFLEGQLARVGCDEWIFDTSSPGLKRIATDVLGFTESTHELVRPIASPGTSGTSGTTEEV